VIGPSASFQGASVALSVDGNTAVVGGPLNNGQIGTTWVFIRSNGAWAQQAKLVGSGAVGYPEQGHSVLVATLLGHSISF
jgi:hypothetical protein